MNFLTWFYVCFINSFRNIVQEDFPLIENSFYHRSHLNIDQIKYYYHINDIINVHVHSINREIFLLLVRKLATADRQRSARVCYCIPSKLLRCVTCLREHTQFNPTKDIEDIVPWDKKDHPNVLWYLHNVSWNIRRCIRQDLDPTRANDKKIQLSNRRLQINLNLTRWSHRAYVYYRCMLLWRGSDSNALYPFFKDQNKQYIVTWKKISKTEKDIYFTIIVINIDYMRL